MSIVTVRLQYAGLRVENQAHESEVAAVAERMALRHGIKVTTRLLARDGQKIPSRGRVVNTDSRARFSIVTDTGADWFESLT